MKSSVRYDTNDNKVNRESDTHPEDPDEDMIDSLGSGNDSIPASDGADDEAVKDNKEKSVRDSVSGDILSLSKMPKVACETPSVPSADSTTGSIRRARDIKLEKQKEVDAAATAALHDLEEGEGFKEYASDNTQASSDDSSSSTMPSVTGIFSQGGGMLQKMYSYISTSVLSGSQQNSISEDTKSEYMSTSKSATPAVVDSKASFDDTDDTLVHDENLYVKGGNLAWVHAACIIRFRGSNCSYDSTTPSSHFQTASTESNIPFTLEGSLSTLRRTGFSGDGDDVQALDDALSAICRLIQGSRERQIIVGRQGGCAAVSKTLQAHVESIIICESALQALYWLALPDVNKPRLVAAGTVQSIALAMSQHSNIEMVAELSCKALCCLATNSSTRSLWASSGVFGSLEEMVAHHTGGSELVMEWICRALFCLTECHPENRETLAGTMLPCILVDAALNTASHQSPDVLKWGCRAVGNLAFQCKTNKHTLGRAGACELVICIMKNFGTEDAILAESACFALANLAYPNPQNQDIIRQQGGIAILVSILERHKKSLEVVRESCIAIRNVVLDNDASQEDIGTSTNVCHFLVDINKKFEQQQHQNQRWENIEDIIHWVWYATSSLALHRSNRHRLMDNGIGETMVNILKRSSTDSEKTCQWVCSTLAKIAEDDVMGSRLGNIGISRGIVVCSRRFTGNSWICACLCKAVGFMAGNTDIRIWLGAAGVCESIVSMLQRHLGSRYVAEQALWAISNLVVNHVGNLTKMGQSGACKLIPRVVLKYSGKSVFLSEWGCKAICNLSVNTENAVKLGVGGACDAIAFATLKHISNSEIIEWACKAIVNIASQESNWPKFRSSLVADALEAIFINHLENRNIIEWVCLSANAVTLDSQMSSKMGTMELCESVIEMLLHYRNDEVIAEHACTLLVNFSHNEISNTEKLGKCGASEAIVSVMKIHVSCGKIVAISLNALSNLAENEENRVKLGVAGACEVVIDILNRHKTDLVVVRAVCRAVSWLSLNNAQNTANLGRTNACEGIVKALDKFQTDSGVAEFACRSISTLAIDADNRAQLGVYNACEIVVSCFDEYILNSGVMFQTSMAVGSLARDHLQNAVKMAALGACGSLVRSMRTHLSDVSVCWSGCRAFDSLSSQYDTLERDGCGETIVQIMIHHSKNDLVLEWGCQAISSMAKDQENRDTLVASGACEAVIVSLQRGTGSGDVLVAVVLQKCIGSQSLALAACKAVHTLGADHDIYRERLGANGACEAVAKVLQKYADNEQVAYTGCEAIVTLATKNFNNRSKLGNAGACKSILMALEMHRTSQLVAMWGCRAVEIMVDGHDSNIAKMGSAGVCDAVAIAMQTHQASPEVAGAGCGAVASLALYDRNTMKLGVAGACEAVVSAVQRHAHENIIAVKGFSALANLAMNPGNSGWLGPAGACSALMAAVQHHIKDEVAAHSAWRAVANLCGEEGNIARLGDSGACEAVVDAMRVHIGNERATEECCRSIAGLARDDSNLQKLVAAKVCESVVIALQVQQTSTAVVIQAYLAVFELASRGRVTQNLLSAEGCCDAVYSTLKSHGTENVSAVKHGCMAIQALSCNNLANQSLLGNNDVIELIVHYLQIHGRSEEAVAEGVVALRCLLDGCIANIHLCSGAAICSLLTKLFEKHMKSLRVAVNSCYVLFYLTSHPPLNESDSDTSSVDRDISSNITALTDRGVYSILVAALHKHILDPEFAIICCQASSNIATTADGKFRLGGAGICKALTKVMQIHIDNFSVCTAVCHLILNLSVDYDANKSKLGSAGICRFVVTAMQQFYQRVEFAELCCRVICVLCAHQESNRVKLVSAGAVDIVTIVLQFYAVNSVAPQWASSALAILGGL